MRKPVRAVQFLNSWRFKSNLSSLSCPWALPPLQCTNESGCHVVVGADWLITTSINESLAQCKVLQVPLLSYLNLMINSLATQLCHRGTLPSSSTSNMCIKITWSDSITFHFLYQAAKLYLNAYRCVFGMSGKIAGVWLLLKCDNDYHYNRGMNRECWLEVETWGSRKGIMLSA